MARLFELMDAPLGDLAETVLDEKLDTVLRRKAHGALNARLPELNGQGWARTSQEDMMLINRALMLDFSVFDGTDTFFFKDNFPK